MKRQRSHRGWWLVLAVLLGGLIAALLVRHSEVELGGRKLGLWVGDLTDGSDPIRRHARETLLKEPDRALPGLVHRLEGGPHPVARQLAVWGNRFFPEQISIPDVSRTQIAVAAVLGEFGTNGIPAVPALLRAARSPNWNVAEQARVSLLKLGSVVAPAIADSLGRVGAPTDQAAWADILNTMGARATNATPELVAAVGRSDASVVVRIMRIWEQPVFNDPGVEETIVGCAMNSSPAVRAAALSALGERTGSSSEVRAVIQSNLAHPEQGVQFQAAIAWWLITGDASTSLGIIREGLRFEPTRVQAVSMLGRMGAAAAPAVPDLVVALIRERNPRPVRTPPSAGLSLSRIDVGALTAIEPLLENPEPVVRLNAVVAIGLFGNRGRTSAPQLLPLLDDADQDVRQATALTLASIGFHTPQAVPVLRSIVDRADDPFMVTWAGDALAEIEQLR